MAVPKPVCTAKGTATPAAETATTPTPAATPNPSVILLSRSPVRINQFSPVPDDFSLIVVLLYIDFRASLFITGVGSDIIPPL